jgi:hypothetical protein
MNKPSIVKEKDLHRLVCTAINSILGIMTADTSQGTRNANHILSDFGINQTSTRSDMFSTLFFISIELLSQDSIQSWNLELVSYVITLYTMLEVHGEVNDEIQNKIQIIHKMFDTKWDDDQKSVLQDWKSEWLKKSDYFRFILLMISNKRAEEDRWLYNAQKLTNISSLRTA